MSNPTLSLKRYRGGQPGNINALKHGFYTRRFNKTDLAGVESTDCNNLKDEIAIIRLYARRLIELDDKTGDISQVSDILRILCLASLTITRLVKTSHFLQVNAGSSDSELHRALEELTRTLKLDQSEPPDDDVFQLDQWDPPEDDVFQLPQLTPP